MQNSENQTSETEGSFFLNEMIFGLYENELGVVGAIEAIKNLDISKQKVDSNSKIEQLKHLISILKGAEKEILLALFQGKDITTIKIPLSKKNIKTLEPILKKVSILMIYRNERNQELLDEIGPILMGESDGEEYYLDIEVNKNKDGEQYIKTIKIKKNKDKEKSRKGIDIEDSDNEEYIS